MGISFFAVSLGAVGAILLSQRKSPSNYSSVRDTSEHIDDTIEKGGRPLRGKSKSPSKTPQKKYAPSLSAITSKPTSAARGLSRDVYDDDIEVVNVKPAVPERKPKARNPNLVLTL